MSNRLGTKAETIVMTWPFLSNGCGSKGGKAESTLETVFQGARLKQDKEKQWRRPDMIFRIFRNIFFYILTKRPRYLMLCCCFSIVCLGVLMVCKMPVARCR